VKPDLKKPLTEQEKARQRKALEHGIEVFIYLNDKGQLIQETNGEKIILHPFLKFCFEDWNKQARDWKRVSISEYKPNDFWNYIEKESERSKTGNNLKRCNYCEG